MHSAAVLQNIKCWFLEAPFVALAMLSLMVLSYAFLVVCIFVLSRLTKSRGRPPLPPGPPADPIIGHLRIMPTENLEVVFNEWSKKYGNVIQIRFAGRSIIVANDAQSAIDLLDRRSGNYSDRNEFTLYKMLGWGSLITFLRYGPRFRKHRRLLHSSFTPAACVGFQPLQTELSRSLARKLIADPDNFDRIINWFSVALVMRITYGRRVGSDADEYVQIAREAAASFANAGSPGGSTVDIFPFVQYLPSWLPSWFPGIYYVNYARNRRPAVRKFHDLPFEDVKSQLAAGTAERSYVATQLESFAGFPLSEEESEDIKGTAAAIYAAGHDTTWSVLLTFLLAMVLYPEAQKRAQAEIDCVIGSDRLPEVSDKHSLPYVACLVQEVLRWRPVVPLGVPHCSIDDDIYKGMFIPGGSMVFANAAAILSDEKVHEDPDRFNPSRFLPQPEGNSEPHPQAAFGYGRRVCPGRHFASASLFISIATLLATLNISRKLDKNGHEIIPRGDFQSALASHPKPFPCDISPRSTKAEKFLSQT